MDWRPATSVKQSAICVRNRGRRALSHPRDGCGSPSHGWYLCLFLTQPHGCFFPKISALGQKTACLTTSCDSCWPGGSDLSPRSGLSGSRLAGTMLPRALPRLWPAVALSRSLRARPRRNLLRPTRWPILQAPLAPSGLVSLSRRAQLPRLDEARSRCHRRPRHRTPLRVAARQANRRAGEPPRGSETPMPRPPPWPRRQCAPLQHWGSPTHRSERPRLCPKHIVATAGSLQPAC